MYFRHCGTCTPGGMDGLVMIESSSAQITFVSNHFGGGTGFTACYTTHLSYEAPGTSVLL